MMSDCIYRRKCGAQRPDSERRSGGYQPTGWSDASSIPPPPTTDSVVTYGGKRMNGHTEDAANTSPAWTKVEDGLPEEDERVLAYFPDMAGSDCEIQISKGWALNKYVSHWMPLPNPPKGQKVGCSK